MILHAYAENAIYVMIGIDLHTYDVPESASLCRDEILSSLLKVYSTEPYRLNKIFRGINAVLLLYSGSTDSESPASRIHKTRAECNVH